MLLAAADVVKVVPPIGPSSELTHAGRPYELTLLVSTVLVLSVFKFLISSSRYKRKFFFFQVTTRLQYIEDYEPGHVIDGMLCSEQRKQTKGATKLSN